MTRKPMANTTALLLLSAVISGGCYSEGLDIRNLSGTIRIPKSAATRTFTDPATGDPLPPTTSVGLIGPVYIGLYASLDYQSEDYPYPELGPAATAFPYGGTTVGDIRNACFEFFQCRLISGRFSSYDEIVDWFTDVVGTPPLDANDEVITSGEYIRQTCFDLLDYTADYEIQILPGDRDGDGSVTAADLDFIEDGDDYIGRFEILQQDFIPGMAVWAFMDSPSLESFTFSTCNDENGFNENTYNRDYQVGLQFSDILNFPTAYVESGDWVVSKPYVWDDGDAPAEVTIDFQVGTDEIEDIDLGTGE